MTPLTARLKHYIAIRRSLGYDLSFAERVLRLPPEHRVDKDIPWKDLAR